MAKIFCIANQKGGVGKTTTTVNLAAGLAKIGQRVLLVDLDPQGNATMGSGVDKRALELTVYDVLLESATIKEAAVKAEQCGYSVLGANRELAGAEVELVTLQQREKRLKAAEKALSDEDERERRQKSERMQRRVKEAEQRAPVRTPRSADKNTQFGE